jgi:hypothetical protein
MSNHEELQRHLGVAHPGWIDDVVRKLANGNK